MAELPLVWGVEYEDLFDPSIAKPDGAFRIEGGMVCHCSDNALHRLDGPAVEWPSGKKDWLQNGRFHRLDGPAVEWANGSKEWYQNGELHRLDGPASEYADGTKLWYQNGKLHRSDGPAVEWADGSKEWQEAGVHLDAPSTPR